MLELLKTAGNPYYQFGIDSKHFQERCKERDPEGYEILYPEDTEEETCHNIKDKIECNESLMESSEESKANAENCPELQAEIDYISNDQ